ncbi:hypothetical protein VSS74_13720 [Conexibacter stalactiti]|uniref:Uncharacterized protein n=1 Tax=Conexibacter stalactiti TaxID=1940611 RepID=A0ABU4HRT5_9ACTN|nr:hypothetical protein [Conexibacter stalactiti]MDW5595402.1 hypothetical protein [Conexibacter stalactiti]MEC5036044.1 hypothetical protein [Conexibacter stalactiti]
MPSTDLPSARRRGALAAAVATLALLAPAAGAAGETATFRLDATGSGSYSAHLTGPISTRDETARFSWTISVPQLTFTDGRLTYIGGGSTALVASATYASEDRGSDGRVSWSRCAGDSFLDPGSPSWDMDRHAVPIDGAAEMLLFRPLRGIDVTTRCVDSADNEFEANTLLNDAEGLPLGDMDFDSAFSLPQVALDHELVIVPTRSRPSAQTRLCISWNPATICDFQWTQELRFTRIDGGPRAPVTPPVTPAPAEPPRAPVVVAPQPARPFAPVVNRGDARLAPGARSVTFTVRCPGGCSGSATATAGRRTVGRTAVTVRAGAKGGTQRITLRFGSKAARAAIRRAGGVRIALTLRAAGGGATATRSITVKSAKSGKRAQAARSAASGTRAQAAGSRRASRRAGIRYQRRRPKLHNCG